MLSVGSTGAGMPRGLRADADYAPGCVTLLPFSGRRLLLRRSEQPHPSDACWASGTPRVRRAGPYTRRQDRNRRQPLGRVLQGSVCADGPRRHLPVVQGPRARRHRRIPNVSGGERSHQLMKCLILWRPLLSYGYSCITSCARPG